YRLNNREAGDTCFDHWLTMTRALHGQHSPEVGQVLEDQAHFFMRERRFDRAETLLRECVLCTGDLVLADTLASRYYLLGRACYEQPNRRPQAIEPLEQSLRISRERDAGEEPSLRMLWGTVNAFAAMGEFVRINEIVDAHARAMDEAEIPRPRITAMANAYAQFLEQQADLPANQHSRASIRLIAAQLRTRWAPLAVQNQQ